MAVTLPLIIPFSGGPRPTPLGQFSSRTGFGSFPAEAIRGDGTEDREALFFVSRQGGGGANITLDLFQASVRLVEELETARVLVQSSDGSTTYLSFFFGTRGATSYPGPASADITAYDNIITAPGTIRLVFALPHILPGPYRGTAAVEGEGTLNEFYPVSFAGKGTAGVTSASTLAVIAPPAIPIAGTDTTSVEGEGALFQGIAFDGRETGAVTGTALLSVVRPTAIPFAGRATGEVLTGTARQRRLDVVEAGNIEIATGRATAEVSHAASLDVQSATGIMPRARGTAAVSSQASLSVVRPTAVPIVGTDTAAVEGEATLNVVFLVEFDGKGTTAVTGEATANVAVIDYTAVGEGAVRALDGFAPVYALEISHSALETPIRIVADIAEHVIDGTVFTPLAFRALPPTFTEGEIPRANLEVDNIGKTLTEWIEISSGGRGAEMRVMMIHKASETEPSSVVWELPALAVGVTEITNETVQIALVYRSGRSRPGVKWRNDRETSPGLFPG